MPTTHTLVRPPSARRPRLRPRLRAGAAGLLGACALVLGPAGAWAQVTEGPLSSVPLVLPPNVVAANAVNLALRKGDKQAALQAADEGLKQFPRDAQLRFLRAVVLSDLNRTDEATTMLEALNADFPELPEPYNNLAVIRAGQRRYADAEHLLQQAIATQANYVTARENLGDLYISMAIDAYEQAGRLDPTNPAVKRKLALARELGGKLPGARSGR